MRRLLPLFLLLFTRVATAGVPYQVVDLKLAPDTVWSSDPFFGAALNGRILFSATTPATGREAWSTDGTPAGTVLLKDIAPGQSDSYAGGFVTVGNLAYFSAYIGDFQQLWQTDGTPAGTRRSDVTGYPLAALGSKLLTVDDSNQLRITDGTVAGTTLLAALGPTTNTDSGFIGPADDHSLYLAGGWGLWRTDGTVAGTKLLNGVHVANAVKAGNSLIFIGSDPTTGREPWISDGTAAGTHMIRELVAGTGSAFSPIQRIPMAAAGNRAVFATLNGDVWSTDGTAAGTSMILQAQATQNVLMAAFNGYVYFNGSDGNGQELWRTDGTAAGTALFKDINPGPASSSPVEFGPTSSRLFFYANDGTDGSELWATDGSVAGTRLVRDINPGPSGSLGPFQLSFTAGDRVYFEATDKLHGGEPWTSDGTESGTQMIADLGPEAVGSSNPHGFAPATDGVYFVAGHTDDASLPTLWTTDGSASGTKRLFTFADSSQPAPVAIGKTLFFTHNGDLWKSDGTVSGTTRVKALGLSNIDSTTVIDGHLYVNGYAQGPGFGMTIFDASGNQVLWLAGNQPVSFAGKIYYEPDDKSIGYTDLTASGTHVAWHVPTGLTKSSPLYPADGTLYFFLSANAGSGNADVQLWKSNGTADGVQFVKSLGNAGVSKGVTAAGSTLFFVAGYDLWRSDGTADGTFKLKTIGDFNYSLDGAFSTAVFGDHIVFVGTDADHGRELWVSDGTVDGTHVLSDINPGQGSSITTTAFCVADGIAYFAASDGSHGTELWQTDGTQAGTMMVADLDPGSSGSTPYSFTRANDLLYFSATTSANGRELWAMPLPKNAAVTTSDVTAKKSDPSVTVSVRLTRPAPARISVDYATVDSGAKAGTDYVSKSGTLTFETGDSQKTIQISLMDDGAIGPTKNFLVHLQSAAPLERSAAAVDILNDHTRADIGLLPAVSYLGQAWSMFNNGPSPASDVRLCYTSTALGTFVVCDAPYELASGATHGSHIDGGLPGSTYVGGVVAAEADPNMANNRITFSTSGFFPDITIMPAMPQVGNAATIWLSKPATANDATYTMTSTDPSVLNVPASVTFPANVQVISFNVTPTRPGNATLAVSTNPDTLTLRVVPATENRLPVKVDTTTPLLLVYAGGITETAFAVGGRTLDGVLPTGVITVFVDGQQAKVLPLYGSKTQSFVLPGGRAGQTHTVRAIYAGDSNFIDGQSVQWNLVVGLGSVSAAAEGLRGPEQKVDVILRGGDGIVPTGTVTVRDETTIYVTNAALNPLDAAAAHVTLSGIPPSVRILSVFYSGDSNYLPKNSQVSIVGPYGRAVRH